MTTVLLVCACAAVSGARSIDELAEWGERVSDTLLANQPTAHRQLAAPALAGHPHPAHHNLHRTRPARVPLDQDLLHRGRTRRDRLPYARLAIRVHQAGPADLATAVRGHWSVMDGFLLTDLDLVVAG